MSSFDAGDYGSEFDSESDSERKRKKKRRDEELPRKKHKKEQVASKEVLNEEYEKGEGCCRWIIDADVWNV